MATEFKLPDLGEDIDEAEVIGILVSVGDVVEVEQGVIEIETEKANVEVPAPDAGTIAAIHVQVGDMVKTGHLIATVEPTSEPTAEPASEPASAPSAAAAEAPASPPEQSPEPAGPAEPPTPSAAPTPLAPQEPAALPTSATALPASPPVRADGDRPDERPLAAAAPSVRLFAREIGVDVDAVAGTGPGGRVSIDDVKAHARKTPQRPTATAAAAGASPLPDFSSFGETNRERMNGVRRTIAREMSSSWTQIPHVTLYQKADITELDDMRRRARDRVAEAGGNLTLLPILVKVVAVGLRSFPRLNASIDVEAQEVVYKDFVHIGVAVDTDRGLLVPVIRDADRKSVTAISVELVELSAKARDGKLGLDEMRGPTFSLSNLGGLGTGFFTPLIHLPESAILGVGRGEREPVWIDGEFQPRMRVPLSLSHDHRLTDGADGARFLNWLVEALENPLLLALD